MSRQSNIQNDRLAAEAAEWFVRLNQRHVPSSVRQGFVEWMLGSPAHLAAYLEAVEVGGEVRALEGLPSKEELVAAAKADRSPANVIELQSRPRRDRGTVTCRRRVNRRRPVRFGIAASFVVAALALGGIILRISHESRHLQTQIGEQRSVVLDEGSTVLLNTNSDLQLAFSQGERRLELNRGEARFTVTKDPERPFIVVTPQATVRALGTIFNVHIEPHGTVVDVIEGHVAVKQRNRAGATHLLSFDKEIPVTGEAEELHVGEHAAVPNAGVIRSGPTEPLSNVFAWPRHKISFQDKTLTDLIAEFNRYHKRLIVIADAELATHEVDGTFDAFDHDSLLDYLERYQDVKVDRRPDGTIVLRRKL
jgi:transmembrane sensor